MVPHFGQMAPTVVRIVVVVRARVVPAVGGTVLASVDVQRFAGND